MEMRRKGRFLAAFIIFLLLADQAIKVAVKLNMTLGESISVCGNWFQLLFIENPGMAFGMEISSAFWGKLLLSLLRIVLIIVLLRYIVQLLKRDSAARLMEREQLPQAKAFGSEPLIVPLGVFIGVSLIFVGAVGNVLDSLFYGLFFGESTPFEAATLFPSGGGYAPILFGKVVDMFYFPIIDTQLPSWVPIWGGEHFVFFRPIFNFADACVSVGVCYLILFQRAFFKA